MSIPPADRVPLRVKFFHGFGSIAYGIKDNGFSTFLLIFYNQVLGMEAALVSAALMLALVIDAFADPVIGHLSDRTYTRWGRRLPWLYIAPIPLAFAWLLMWAPPPGIGGWIFVYLVVVAIVVRTLLSCCEVPSVSLVAELTADYDERTSLMRFRYLFGWAGGLLLLFLAYDVFLVPTEGHPVGQLNPEGYWRYGLFGAGLMATAVIVSALGQHKRVARWPDSKPQPTTVGQSLGEIRESLSHRAFLVLIGAGAIAYTSQGVTFSIANYLYIFVWQFSKEAFQIYPWMLFASVIGSFFLVGPLNRKFGKKMTAMICGAIGAVFWVTPFILRVADIWPAVGSTTSTALLFVFFFFANVFSVMVMISASSMIADIVEASQEVTGRRTEGLFFAGNFFMQKCATGLGIFITGLIVSLSGMPEKALPGQVDEGVINGLTISYCIVVTVAVIVSTTIFSRFPITRADHEERLRKLAVASLNPAE
jgi:glycoside/pentoside/hexuronide:cation symporter, GPH family